MSKTKTIKDPEVLKLFSDIIKEQRMPEKAILYFKGDNMKAPIWFQEFEKKNDERWEQQIEFNKNISDRLDKVIIKNKLKT